MTETISSMRPTVIEEHIETGSSNKAPWWVRVGFGFTGLILLAGAFVAWRFGPQIGGSVGQAMPWIIAAAVLLGAGAILETLTVEIWLALIVGAFAVAVTFLVVGRVTTYTVGPSVFVVDRFNARVEYCTTDSCKMLPRAGRPRTGLQLPQMPGAK